MDAIPITSKKFWTVDDLSSYLTLKKSTIYRLVETGELPHYRIGRLIRFKPSESEAWIESRRSVEKSPGQKAKVKRRAVSRPSGDIDRLVRKLIAETKGSQYNFCNGKPGLKRKEESHGTF